MAAAVSECAGAGGADCARVARQRPQRCTLSTSSGGEWRGSSRPFSGTHRGIHFVSARAAIEPTTSCVRIVCSSKTRVLLPTHR